jgi:hypothetical protein
MKMQARSKRPKAINQIISIFICPFLVLLPWIFTKQEMNWVVDVFWDKEF